MIAGIKMKHLPQSQVLQPRLSCFHTGQLTGQDCWEQYAPHSHGVVTHLIGQSFGVLTGGTAKGGIERLTAD